MKNQRNYSVSEAKSKFSEVLHQAKDAPMFISSRGKDIGVVLSKENYDRLLDQEKRNLPKMRISHFLEVCQELRAHLPEQLKLSKRKSRKSPSFD